MYFESIPDSNFTVITVRNAFKIQILRLQGISSISMTMYIISPIQSRLQLTTIVYVCMPMSRWMWAAAPRRVCKPVCVCVCEHMLVCECVFLRVCYTRVTSQGQVIIRQKSWGEMRGWRDREGKKGRRRKGEREGRNDSKVMLRRKRRPVIEEEENLRLLSSSLVYHYKTTFGIKM